jgi:hypothetical protein
LFFSSGDNKILKAAFLCAGIIWSLYCISILFSSSVDFCYDCSTTHIFESAIFGVLSLFAYILSIAFQKNKPYK